MMPANMTAWCLLTDDNAPPAEVGKGVGDFSRGFDIEDIAIVGGVDGFIDTVAEPGVVDAGFVGVPGSFT